MALQKSIDFRGLPVESAYWRVQGMTWTAPASLVVSVDVYASAESRNNETEPLFRESFQLPFDISDPNTNVAIAFNQIRTLLYGALKSLPEFGGAVDVLESPAPVDAPAPTPVYTASNNYSTSVNSMSYQSLK